MHRKNKILEYLTNFFPFNYKNLPKIYQFTELPGYPDICEYPYCIGSNQMHRENKVLEYLSNFSGNLCKNLPKMYRFIELPGYPGVREYPYCTRNNQYWFTVS